MLAKRLFLIPVAAYVVWLSFDYEYHFLDGVNLLFHEGGHIFLAFFGETIHFLGGTIAQLFFPLACAFQFLRDGKVYETFLMGIWFAESSMYMAHYLGDAQAQALPLVGGHIHDWNWLLSRWGMLEHCEAIATGLHFVAALVAVACLVGAALVTRDEEEFEMGSESNWSA